MKCDYFTTRSVVTFDCVAVHLAYSEDITEIEPVRFRITDDGFTKRDPDGPFKARVALRWKDRSGFQIDLANRLISGPPTAASQPDRHRR